MGSKDFDKEKFNFSAKRSEYFAFLINKIYQDYKKCVSQTNIFCLVYFIFKNNVKNIQTDISHTLMVSYIIQYMLY